MPAVLITKKGALTDFDTRSSIKLDEVLRNKDRDNLIVYAGQELSANSFKMLMLNRIDGLIGLPDEAMYQAEKMGLRDQLAPLVIEENQKNYAGWFCAVGCSNNGWGRAVIDKINKILLQQHPSARYRGAYERWLDANSLERYRPIYQEVFLKTTSSDT